ncbi:hypothetical protein C8R44DRAFT_729668 [Mycena epipterygia]|nr:hypothetical protein C8R44DRAFT_729668 [Mycena epipterygia]
MHSGNNHKGKRRATLQEIKDNICEGKRCKREELKQACKLMQQLSKHHSADNEEVEDRSGGEENTNNVGSRSSEGEELNDEMDKCEKCVKDSGSRPNGAACALCHLKHMGCSFVEKKQVEQCDPAVAHKPSVPGCTIVIPRHIKPTHMESWMDWS